MAFTQPLTPSPLAPVAADQPEGTLLAASAVAAAPTIRAAPRPPRNHVIQYKAGRTWLPMTANSRWKKGTVLELRLFRFFGGPGVAHFPNITWGTPRTVLSGNRTHQLSISGTGQVVHAAPGTIATGPARRSRARQPAVRAKRVRPVPRQPAKIVHGATPMKILGSGMADGGAYVRAEVPSEIVSVEVKVGNSPLWKKLASENQTRNLTTIAPQISQPNYLGLARRGVSLALTGGTQDQIVQMLADAGVANATTRSQIVRDVMELMGCSNRQAKHVMDQLVRTVNIAATDRTRNDSLQDILNRMMNLRAGLDPRYTPLSTAINVANGGPGNPEGNQLEDFFAAILQGSGAGSISRAAMVGVDQQQNGFGQVWFDVWGKGVVGWTRVGHRPGRWNNWIMVSGNPNYYEATDKLNVQKQFDNINLVSIEGLQMQRTAETRNGTWGMELKASLDDRKATIRTNGAKLLTGGVIDASEAQAINAAVKQALPQVLMSNLDEINKALKAELTRRGLLNASGQPIRGRTPSNQDWPATISSVLLSIGGKLYVDLADLVDDKLKEQLGEGTIQYNVARAYVVLNMKIMGYAILSAGIVYLLALDPLQVAGPIRILANAALAGDGDAAAQLLRLLDLRPPHQLLTAQGRLRNAASERDSVGVVGNIGLGLLTIIGTNLAETDARSVMVYWNRNPPNKAAALAELQSLVIKMQNPGLSILPV